MNKDSIYRVRFIGANQRHYELYCREVFQGELYGFVVLRGLLLDQNTSSVVVDPAEEKLRAEFDGVEMTHIPMHAVVRIDAVAKRGVSKVADPGKDSVVTVFPGALQTPQRD